MFRTSTWKEFEHEPDGRMGCAANHLPGIAVVAHVPAPGQRLVGDAQPAGRRALAELAKIGRRPVDPTQRLLGDVAADQEQIAAELLHDVELALGPGEHLRALRLGHAFEIPERLEGDDPQAEIADHSTDVGGRAVEAQQVVFEDFDPRKPRSSNGRELLLECAAQTDGRNRSLHE